MKQLATISFFILMTAVAMGQPAEEYFHGGAQSFINDDLQTAISQVQEGLNQYPDDAKLQALMAELQKEQERQQQNQDQEQNQDQQQNNEDQQQEQQNQQEQEQEQENQEQQEQEGEGENQGEQSPEEMQGDPLESKQISKEEAEKILRALAQKEKELLKEFKKKKSDGSAKHDKDW